MEEISDISEINLRLDNYAREERDILRKLGNGVPEGKREKLNYRLKDIRTRLMPATHHLISSMTSMN